MMKRLVCAVLALSLVVLTRTAGAYPWDQDMVDQPSEKPQESAAPPTPANSVPVGLKFEPAPLDLNKTYTRDQTDGQLFFTLTRGGGVMPFYRDALSPEERWDVINYIKQEFGDR